MTSPSIVVGASIHAGLLACEAARLAHGSVHPYTVVEQLRREVEGVEPE